MHLFGEDKPVTRTSDPNVELARKLYNFLNSQNLIFKRINLKYWARAFNVLAKNWSVVDITDVLEWYIHNYQSCPIKINNAIYFCERFNRIKLEYDKSKTEVSDLTKRILSHCNMDCLPNGLDQQMPFVIEQSLERASILIKKINAVWAKSQDQLIQRTIKYLFDCGFLNPKSLVETWLGGVIVPMMEWTGWSGDASSLILNPDSPRFNSFWRGFIYNWCGSSARWDELMELVRRGS